MQVKAWVQTDFGEQGLLSAPGIFRNVEACWHPLRSNALGVDLRGPWRLPHYMNWCVQEGECSLLLPPRNQESEGNLGLGRTWFREQAGLSLPSASAEGRVRLVEGG